MSDHDEIAADIRAALDETAGQALQTIEVDTSTEEPVDLPEEPEQTGDQRERDAHGKFVAKSEEVAQDTTDQPSEAVADPAEKLAIRAPASWSPAAKAEFEKLSPSVQQAVAKREQEIDHGLRRKSEELKRYDPLEQVIAPRRAVWAAQGMDEAQAVKTLLAAQDLLEKDARQGIEYLAKAYGISLNMAQPGQGQAQQAPQPAGISPDNSALLQRIAQLEQNIQQAQTAPLVGQVESFFADPKNLYAENVRQDMAHLLNSGQAQDLADAYEKACWMRPDIRPLLQTPRVNGVVSDPARVERAKAAGASVTGSPSAAPIAAKGDGSIEDDIRLAFAEVASRA